MTFETLRHHWELRQQLEKQENLLCELRHSAQAASHAPDGMPRTKGVSDKVGTLAIAIVDLEECIAYLKKTIAADPVTVPETDAKDAFGAAETSL